MKTRPTLMWRQRLQQILKAKKLGERVLSRAAGLNERAVGQMLTRTDNPGIESVAAVARVLGTSVGYLYDGEVMDRQRVRVLGAIATGEEWHVYPEGLDEIDMSVEGGDPVGVEVRGNSMSPVYRDGDLLIGGRKHANLAALVGSDCILALADGRKFVKYLTKGRVRGRYNLRSYNPTFGDIEDVEVEWAAPISWICRRHPS